MGRFKAVGPSGARSETVRAEISKGYHQKKPPRPKPLLQPTRRIDRLRHVKGESAVEGPSPSTTPLVEMNTTQGDVAKKISRRKAKWEKIQSYVKPVLATAVDEKEEPLEAQVDENEKPATVLENAGVLAEEQAGAAIKIETVFRGYLARLALVTSHQIAAATKIQAAFRSVGGRRDLLRHRSARTIQSVWRGVGPRAVFTETLRQAAIENQAATKIQAFWRMVLPHYQLLGFRAARKLQAVWRCHAARSRLLKHRKEAEAATKIQAQWRCLRGEMVYSYLIYDIITIQSVARCYIACRRRSRSCQRLLREASAIKIQTMVRGYNERKEFDILREMFLLQCCAVDVQRVFRGHRVRKRVAIHNFIMGAVITIQTCWRRYQAEQSHWYTIGSVIEIQCLARKAAARNYFTTSLAAVILVQCTVRGWLARREHKRLSDDKQRFLSARLIQASWRAAAARGHYERHLAAVVIQAAFRSFSARFRYVSWMAIGAAATKIQTAWRGFLCYSDYTLVCNDILTIQRCYRGHVGRKRFKSKKKRRDRRKALDRFIELCATDIQRLYRGHAARTEVENLRYMELLQSSATRIQCRWRIHAAQEKRFYAVGSAIIVQAFTRGVVERFKFMDTLGQIIISQSVVRSYIARQRFKNMKLKVSVLEAGHYQQELEVNAARILQRFYSRTVRRRTIEVAAKKIQSFFRMVKAMVDTEIKAAAKRRKMRKMSKNCTKNVDELMLENAWGSLSISGPDNDIPEPTRRRGTPRSGSKSRRSDSRRREGKPVSDRSFYEARQNLVESPRGGRSRRNHSESSPRKHGAFDQEQATRSSNKRDSSLSRSKRLERSEPSLLRAKHTEHGSPSATRPRRSERRSPSASKKKRSNYRSPSPSTPGSPSPSKQKRSQPNSPSPSKADPGMGLAAFHVHPGTTTNTPVKKTRLPPSYTPNQEVVVSAARNETGIDPPPHPGVVRVDDSDSIVSGLTARTDCGSPAAQRNGSPRTEIKLDFKKPKKNKQCLTNSENHGHTRENEDPEQVRNSTRSRSRQKRSGTNTNRGKSHFRSRSRTAPYCAEKRLT